jgi:hypothetical protein
MTAFIDIINLKPSYLLLDFLFDAHHAEYSRIYARLLLLTSAIYRFDVRTLHFLSTFKMHLPYAFNAVEIFQEKMSECCLHALSNNLLIALEAGDSA